MVSGCQLVIGSSLFQNKFTYVDDQILLTMLFSPSNKISVRFLH